MLSFVVPAHNEERFLRPTLRAIRHAASSTEEPYEVLVVDDASTDATARIAAEEGAIVVSVAHRQIAGARHAGARAASGDLLVFVDADTIVSDAAVRAALAAVRAGAVGGAAIGVFDGTVPLYARLLAASWIRIARLANLTTGCFLFCTRRAYETAGGFDRTLYVFEDLAFGRRLRRVGPTAVLRDTVSTSGRNLRSTSLAAVGRMLLALLRHRGQFLRSRERLDYWYGVRQAAPEPHPPRPDQH
jgi:glycosyltransferase involved in cell wall biosynthesis